MYYLFMYCKAISTTALPTNKDLMEDENNFSVIKSTFDDNTYREASKKPSFYVTVAKLIHCYWVSCKGCGTTNITSETEDVVATMICIKFAEKKDILWVEWVL